MHYNGYNSYEEQYWDEQHYIDEERRRQEEEERRREEKRAEQERIYKSWSESSDSYYGSTSYSSSSDRVRSNNNYYDDYDSGSGSYSSGNYSGGNYQSYSNNGNASSFWSDILKSNFAHSIAWGFIALLLTYVLWCSIYKILIIGAELHLFLIFISATIAYLLFKHKNICTGIPLVLILFIWVQEMFIQGGMYSLLELMPIIGFCMLLSVGSGYLFKKNLNIPAYIVVGLIMAIAAIPYCCPAIQFIDLKIILSLLAGGVVLGLMLGVFKSIHLEFVSVALIGVVICLEFYISWIYMYDFSFLPAIIWFVGLLLICYSIPKIKSIIKKKK